MAGISTDYVTTHNCDLFPGSQWTADFVWLRNGSSLSAESAVRSGWIRGTSCTRRSRFAAPRLALLREMLTRGSDSRLERLQGILCAVIRRTRGAGLGGADHATRLLLPSVGSKVPQHAAPNHAPAGEGRAERQFVGIPVRCEQVG